MPPLNDNTPDTFSSFAEQPADLSASSAKSERDAVALLPADASEKHLPASGAGPQSALAPYRPGSTGQLTGNVGKATQRLPLVIKGEMKKPDFSPPPFSRKRRLLINLAVVSTLLLILLSTLLTVSPLGRELGLNFNPMLRGGDLVKNLNSNPGNIIAQATATAVFNQQNDGHDPNAFGGQTYTNGTASLVWPYGQCTYWANSEYHRMAGFWVSWSGDAYQWVAGAQSAGWIVSQTPHVYSIIVLMPGVQGASGYGHVAVVEKIVNSTTVSTSNMNWYANGGGLGVVSYENFTTGSGVYFIWHP